VLPREPAYVEAYADASYFLVYSTALRGINGAVGTLSTGISVRRLQAGGATSHAALERARPVTFVYWPLFNPVAGYGSFVVPAVFILILQQTLLIGIGALRVAERQEDDSGREPLWAVLGGEARRDGLHLCRTRAVHVRRSIQPVWLPHARLVGRGHPLLGAFFASVTLLGLTIAELFDRPESSTVALAAMGVPALSCPALSFPAEVQAGWVRVLAVVLPSTFGIQGFLQLAEMGARLDQTLRAWGGALDPGGRLLDSRLAGPAVQTTEWAQTERLGRVPSHLGMVRHRSIVEYRIEQHADPLGDLLASLSLTLFLALRRETLQRV